MEQQDFLVLSYFDEIEPRKLNKENLTSEMLSYGIGYNAAFTYDYSTLIYVLANKRFLKEIFDNKNANNQGLQLASSLKSKGYVLTTVGINLLNEEIKSRSKLMTSTEVMYDILKYCCANGTGKTYTTRYVQRELIIPKELFENTLIDMESKGYAENYIGGMFSIKPKGCLIWSDKESSEKYNLIQQLTSMDIFISHSNQDVQIAKRLIDLIRSALNIKADKIRCTSVEGYKLPAGVSTDDQLRKEIFDAKVLIALISTNSIQSAYVLFELGARWGSKLPLIPLISNKLGAELLKGPLKNINALNMCIEAEVFQFINDLGNYLNTTPEQPSVYQNKIKELVELGLLETLPKQEIQTDNIQVKSPNYLFNYTEAEKTIKQYCEKQWPDDYSMRMHCIRKQKEAVTELKNEKPNDITDAEFNSIRQKAAIDWPDDFVMRLHAEKNQINSLRQLKNI